MPASEIPAEARDLVADANSLLSYVGRRGVPVTDARRLRLADVRAINARFVAPAELDAKVGERVFALRSEDGAWRIHLLRVACESAGLLRVRRPRIRATPLAETFASLPTEEAARRLFLAWWRRAPWPYWDLHGGFAASVLDDRFALARFLEGLGTSELSLDDLGERLRGRFAPDLRWEEPYLTPEMWASGVWYSCLDTLGAFGGCVERRESWDVLPDRRVGMRLTPFGVELLRAVSGDAADDALALSPEELERLARLPRASGAWEGEIVVLGSVQIADSGSPTCVVWVDAEDGAVRTLEIVDGQRPLEALLAAFVKGARSPAPECEPGLPQRVYVRDAAIAQALVGPLRPLDIAVERRAELPGVQEALVALVRFLAFGEEPRPWRSPHTPAGRARRRRPRGRGRR